jgi:hypothetical protein
LFRKQLNENAKAAEPDRVCNRGVGTVQGQTNPDALGRFKGGGEIYDAIRVTYLECGSQNAQFGGRQWPTSVIQFLYSFHDNADDPPAPHLGQKKAENTKRERQL